MAQSGAQYRVQSIPTMVLFVGGQEVQRLKGIEAKQSWQTCSRRDVSHPLGPFRAPKPSPSWFPSSSGDLPQLVQNPPKQSSQRHGPRNTYRGNSQTRRPVEFR